jgi:hypothetical protein
MANLVDVDSLNRAAEQYDPVLRILPFNALADVFPKFGMRLLEVKGKDTIVVFERKGGLARPYAAGDDPNTVDYGTEIGKAHERSLEPKTSFVALRENIKNFQSEGKLVTGNDVKAEGIDNQTKKHPLEKLILETKVKTIAEDILDGVFHAKRDEDDKTPFGMFDGYNTIIDADIAASLITVNKGNLIVLGEDPFPTPDEEEEEYKFTAINNLIKFVRSLNPFLRARALVMVPSVVMFACQDSLGQKLMSKDMFEFDKFLEYVRGKAQAPGLNIVTHECLGTGDRLIATLPNNFDFGMNTLAASRFVQVRNPFEDPNWVQFWTQWEAGCRITNIHAKEFAVSDGTNEASQMSGDYIS